MHKYFKILSIKSKPDLMFINNLLREFDIYKNILEIIEPMEQSNLEFAFTDENIFIFDIEDENLKNSDISYQTFLKENIKNLTN